MCDPLSGADRRPLLVIGVGSSLRGDDGAGLEVVRRLKDDRRILTRLLEGEGVELLTLWAGAESVVLVDAVRSGAAAGTIHRFDAGARPLPHALRPPAGHALGVAEAIELARALGQLPRRLVVIGVEGERFDVGAPLSPSVLGAIEPALDAVRLELCDQYSAQRGPRGTTDEQPRAK